MFWCSTIWCLDILYAVLRSYVMFWNWIFDVQTFSITSFNGSAYIHQMFTSWHVHFMTFLQLPCVHFQNHSHHHAKFQRFASKTMAIHNNEMTVVHRVGPTVPDLLADLHNRSLLGCSLWLAPADTTIPSVFVSHRGKYWRVGPCRANPYLGWVTWPSIVIVCVTMAT